MADSGVKEPSPAEKVFDIYELSEQIFLELPMRDLLITAQRLNKRSAAITKSSTRLQQALFFQPVTDFTLECKRDPVTSTLRSWNSRQSIYRHALLFKWLSKEAAAYADASWRRQLLTQPPMARVEYWRGGVLDVATNATGVRMMDIRKDRPGPPTEESYIGRDEWCWLDCRKACFAQIEDTKTAVYDEGWRKISSTEDL